MAEPAPLPVVISPTNSLLHYTGRFDDRRDPNGPIVSWPAGAVALRFEGTNVNVKLNAVGQDFWQVSVDGQPGAVLELKEGIHLYQVTAGLAAGAHTVELMKATEGVVGVTQVLGFQLNDGAKILPVPPRKHRLEVIGDSISAGYGNMTTNPNESFSPRTENAYYTYGAMTARQLDADYLCVAFSGKKMWPDNTLPELYDRTLGFDPKSAWDFSKWTPDVVLINLATNDFGGENPDEAGWTAAYKKFIARVRQNYPKAVIYCAIGTMMNDMGPRRPLTTVRAYLQKVVADVNAAGDQNVRLIDFGSQDARNGIGANGHPSRRTHELMAEQLVTTLRKDCGW